MEYETTYKNSGDIMAHVGSEPNVGALNDELRRAATDYGIGSRVNMVENTRYCRWEGQTDDGKKWSEKQTHGKMAFPWDGASDTRIPLADEVVNGLVDVCSTAFWRSMIRVSPQNVRGIDAAVTAHSLMDWAMNNRMYNDMTREVELLSQYLWTYGWAGAHISWQQEIGQKEQELTVEQLMAIAAQSPQGECAGGSAESVGQPGCHGPVGGVAHGGFPEPKEAQGIGVREGSA